MINPPAGFIGLTQISGRVGSAIQVGEWLNGEGFQVWEHAFVMLPGGLILEAEPGGAVVVDMHYTHVYWCEGIFEASQQVNSASPIQLGQTAERLKGIPYSFADYAALAAHRLHIPAPGLKDFIADNGHMICSQMADEFYLRLGAHIFTDNRWPGYVTPASLFDRNEQLIRH
jgi:hypothetical protein